MFSGIFGSTRPRPTELNFQTGAGSQWSGTNINMSQYRIPQHWRQIEMQARLEVAAERKADAIAKLKMLSDNNFMMGGKPWDYL